VQQQRTAWCRRIRAVDPRRFVFLDETGTHLAMTRLYGRAPRGQRVHDSVPGGHWQITTLVAAVRCDGPTAPLVFEGATDTPTFLAYVEQMLGPQLRRGDIVVMDNLAPHKAECIAAAVTKVGAEVWYLPPYSPDYNPIEAMWSKVKTCLRKAAARTVGRLITAIAQALDAVTPADCRGFFAHCGYPATSICKPL
jgi:transposase